MIGKNFTGDSVLLMEDQMIKENLTQLDNGLRVVTRSIDSFESVVLGYWVEAGGVCEDESNCGISHFLEHMAFKGTTTRTA